jgi:Delta7-sterol 5-desaturase
MDLFTFDNTLPVFLVMMARYLFIAGPAFIFFYILFRTRFQKKRIQLKFPVGKDYLREFTWSVLTALIFSLVAILVNTSYIRPYTLIYSDLGEYGPGYAIFSFAAILIIHDTYFYWTHRIMHHPRIFKFAHLIHHKSVNPSPWAAFAFHPVEAVIEAGVIFPVVFILPVHYITLLVFMIFMTVYNVYGHLGYEIFPSWFNRHKVFRWLNTSVSHNMHHQYFKGNYGLYFRFWDELMGTTHKDYDRKFEKAGLISGVIKENTQHTVNF